RPHQFALFDEREHAWQGVLDDASALFVHFAAKTNRVRHIAPHRGSRLFKFAKQKRFFSPSGKQRLNCLQVCAGHGKNVRCLIDQRGSKRLAAQIANVNAYFRADFDCVKTGRLAAHRVHTGRNNFDVLPVAKQTAKKPFCNRTAADITCTDKEDAFHNSESASERDSNLESNWSKSISPGNSGKSPPPGADERARAALRSLLTLRLFLSAWQMQPEFVPNVQN